VSGEAILSAEKVEPLDGHGSTPNPEGGELTDPKLEGRVVGSWWCCLFLSTPPRSRPFGLGPNKNPVHALVQ